MVEKKTDKGIDAKSVLLGAAAGLAVGAIAGAMTDPKKRDKVKATAQKLSKSAKKTFGKISKQAGDFKDQVVEKVDEMRS